MPIELDIKVGDVVLTGKFKNKRTLVKSIGKDDLGQPTINGMSLLNMRIEKLLPFEKQSAKTREESETKKENKSLDALLSYLLCEESASKEVARKYYKDIKSSNPSLAKDLEDAAEISLKASQNEIEQSIVDKVFDKLLKHNPSLNPLDNADSQGVKTFIDAMTDSEDSKVAGKAKTTFTTAIKRKIKDEYK